MEIGMLYKNIAFASDPSLGSYQRHALQGRILYSDELRNHLLISDQMLNIASLASCNSLIGHALPASVSIINAFENSQLQLFGPLSSYMLAA